MFSDTMNLANACRASEVTLVIIGEYINYIDPLRTGIETTTQKL